MYVVLTAAVIPATPPTGGTSHELDFVDRNAGHMGYRPASFLQTVHVARCLLVGRLLVLTSQPRYQGSTVSSGKVGGPGGTEKTLESRRI
jgi:hypothetical protein